MYGNVSEGSGQNLFVIRDEIIYTPPFSASVLPGITRDSVITIARDLGYEVRGLGPPKNSGNQWDKLFKTGAAGDLHLGADAKADPARKPHFTPKAKHVIFLFLNGGMSQVDTFDHKPALAKYDGQPMPVHNLHAVLSMRLTMQGFIVSEHMDLWPAGLGELGVLVADGKLKFRESISEGLASAPEAFIGLLRGKNFGKQLVRFGP